MKYKKFILFQFDTHQAIGGILDIRGSFDTLDEATKVAQSKPLFDYDQIVDRDTWEIVWEGQ